MSMILRPEAQASAFALSAGALLLINQEITELQQSSFTIAAQNTQVQGKAAVAQAQAAYASTNAQAEATKMEGYYMGAGGMTQAFGELGSAAKVKTGLSNTDEGLLGIKATDHGLGAKFLRGTGLAGDGSETEIGKLHTRLGNIDSWEKALNGPNEAEVGVKNWEMASIQRNGEETPQELKQIMKRLSYSAVKEPVNGMSSPGNQFLEDIETLRAVEGRYPDVDEKLDSLRERTFKERKSVQDQIDTKQKTVERESQQISSRGQLVSQLTQAFGKYRTGVKMVDKAVADLLSAFAQYSLTTLQGIVQTASQTTQQLGDSRKATIQAIDGIAQSTLYRG